MIGFAGVEVGRAASRVPSDGGGKVPPVTTIPASAVGGSAVNVTLAVSLLAT